MSHTYESHGTCGVLDCLLFCDQMWPNYRISLVVYHCSIEFPCGVPLFYCCKYPTLCTHTHAHILKNASLWRLLLFFLLLPNLRYSYTCRLCAQNSLWRPAVFRIPMWRPFVFCFFFCPRSPQGTEYACTHIPDIHVHVHVWHLWGTWLSSLLWHNVANL